MNAVQTVIQYTDDQGNKIEAVVDGMITRDNAVNWLIEQGADVVEVLNVSYVK